MPPKVQPLRATSSVSQDECKEKTDVNIDPPYWRNLDGW